MLVTTHAMVAATVAIKTGNPYIYIPFAAADHFTFDAFPHFGGKWINDHFKSVAIIDAVVGITLFLILARYTKFSVLILLAVCLLAGWPDLLWLTKRRRFPKFFKFHAGIQKFEATSGILIEVAIVAVCLALIFV